MTKFKKSFKIPIDIYGMEIIVVYNYTTSEVREYINSIESWSDKTKEEFNECFDGEHHVSRAYYVGNGINHVICIDEEKDTKELINSISHEVLHFVLGMTRHIHLKPTNSSEEAHCYLMGYVMGEIYDKLIKEIPEHQKKI